MNKVIIIGSGPAGLTAAIYAARANLDPLVFEGIQPGGQLTITTDVENYPGFPGGILGPELMDKFRKQAQEFGAKTLFENIDRVDFSSKPFKIYVSDKEYQAECVIISTGASAKLLGLEAERKLMGFGVSACATCDGFFFKEKNILVVGGGDSAMEEATYLTKFASSVTIVHRREEFRASKIMQERVLNNPKISVIWNSEIVEMHGDPVGKGLESVDIKNIPSGDVKNYLTDGVFMAIGHKPNSDVFKNQLNLNDAGYIITKPDSTSTSVEGVFAAGDIQDFTYKQAITAAGTGCMAAIEAERYLESQ